MEFEEWCTQTMFSFLVPIGKRGRKLRIFGEVSETRNMEEAKAVMAEMLAAKEAGTVNEYIFERGLPEPERA